MGQALAAGPSSPPRDLASSSSPQLGWHRSPAGSSTRTSPQPTWAAHTIPSPKKQVLKVGQGPGSRAKGLPSCCHLPGVQPALCTPGPPPPHTGLCGQPRERPLSAEPLAATLSHFPFLCPPPPFTSSLLSPPLCLLGGPCQQGGDPALGTSPAHSQASQVCSSESAMRPLT